MSHLNLVSPDNTLEPEHSDEEEIIYEDPSIYNEEEVWSSGTESGSDTDEDEDEDNDDEYGKPILESKLGGTINLESGTETKSADNSELTSTSANGTIDSNSNSTTGQRNYKSGLPSPILQSKVKSSLGKKLRRKTSIRRLRSKSYIFQERKSNFG